jgi:hypothetical protein
MRLGAALLLVALGAAPAGAQLLEVQPGARVRVTAPGVLGSKIEAVVFDRRGDTLSLATSGLAPIAVTIASITGIEMYRGKSRSAGARRGMIWGALIGTPAYLFAAAFAGAGECEPSDEECETLSVVALTAEGVLGGAASGAGIGALIGRAQWDELELPARPVVSWVPGRGAVLGVGLRF